MLGDNKLSLESVHTALDDFHVAAKKLFEELHSEIQNVVDQLSNDFALEQPTATQPAIQLDNPVVAPAPVLPPPTVVPPVVAGSSEVTGGSTSGDSPSNPPTEPTTVDVPQDEGPQSGAENSITTETDNSHA